MAPKQDVVAIERLLTVTIESPAGHESFVVLRTPGRDEALLLGLLLGEGLIKSTNEVSIVANDDDATIRAPKPLALRQSLVASTSCSLCGRENVAVRGHNALTDDTLIPANVIAGLPATLRASQTLFKQTGAVHAAGLFSADGTLLDIAEDVGRHNAVDKVVGCSMRENRKAAALCLSGRVSYDLVRKAIAAHIAVIVAVSAPTSLAVAAAESHRLTLCGFVRDGNFNIYSHPHRIAGAPRFFAE